MSKKDWSWNKMIPSDIYNRLAIIGWPGWELSAGEPYYFYIGCTMGGLSSYQVANELDDLIEYQFWYRDYTESGLQIVREGEDYRSIFVFQTKADHDRAFAHYLVLVKSDEI